MDTNKNTGRTLDTDRARVSASRRLLAFAAVATLVATACGGSDQAEPAATEPVTTVATTALPTSAPATTAAPTTSAAPTTEAATTTTTTTSTAVSETSERVVFEDGFDDDGNEWIGDPSLYDGDPIQPAISEGFLTFAGVDEGRSTMWASAIEGEAASIGDQRVSAIVTFSGTGVAAIVCRLTPGGADAPPTFYVADISSAGTYLIGKFAATGPELLVAAPAELKDLFDSGVPPDQWEVIPQFDVADGDILELDLTCTGGIDGPATITLSVGGTQVLEIVDNDPLPTGIGGLGATSSRPHVAKNGFEVFGVAFDDFVFVDLGEHGSVSSAEPAAFATSTCIDEVDDLIDDKGNPLDPNIMGLDLTSAAITLTATEMTLTWAQQGGFPEMGGTDPTGADRPLLWAVSGKTPDGQIIDIAVMYEQGEGYTSGPMFALEPAVDGRKGTVSIKGAGRDAVLTLVVPLTEPIPAGTTYSFYTSYYGVDSEVPRIDDECPNDFGKLELIAG